MTNAGRILSIFAGVALPATAAFAMPPQTADQTYCQALSDTYVRYVGHDEEYSRRLQNRGTLEGQVAVAQCKAGNTAAAIPVLERVLTEQKFTLPARG